MLLLFRIIIIVYLLAFMSQRNTTSEEFHWDIYLVLLVLYITLLAGLRISYNDTSNYISAYNKFDKLDVWLLDMSNLNLLSNPLFYFLVSAFRTLTKNYTSFFLVTSAFINVLNLKFIKRNVDTEDFALSVFLYVALGYLMFTMSALKQALAMAILTMAIEQLLDNNNLRFIIIVFIAGLVHTYAWLYFILILLKSEKPLNFRVFIGLILVFLVVYTFNETITTILETADSIGKSISVEEVFDNYSMNPLRVAMYGLIPIVSLIWYRPITEKITKKQTIFLQMSYINFVFYIFGSIQGANMFGRAGTYFSIGLICVIPWIIKQLFNKTSLSLVIIVTILFSSLYYVYDNRDFITDYRRKSIVHYVEEVLDD